MKNKKIEYYADNSRDMAIFRKTKKTRRGVKYGLGECVSQISRLYRFSFGQGRDTQKYYLRLYVRKYTPPGSRGFRVCSCQNHPCQIPAVWPDI